MRLYYAPRTISVAVAITLTEAGLNPALTRVDFSKGEQTTDAYLKLNPKGRVPVLEAQGACLTETGAILEYIAATNPHAQLVPDDPFAAAHMRSVMFYMASTMHVNHAHGVRGIRWADHPESHADMAAKTAQTMTDSAAYFAAECLRGDYVLGDAFSLADPYAFVVCTWLQGDGVDLANFPSITAYLERMTQRPSVQNAIENGMLPL